MAGFKSFADRLELPLMSGVTAVVGPNGTGKSNLVDAVRWALGEQRARALRAERMEDLLFAGGDRRRPAGMAECAITLDNTDDRLGIGTAEVEVRRRFYRSGDSVYMVNRRPARLRDVDAVMRLSGLRSDGYGIVSQGRVDEVLRAKPQDRLRMVEEAAGIGALEAERARAVAALGEGAAERARLETRREDLVRRVEELRVQAERAERDRQLGVEIRRLEMASAERERRRLGRRAESLEAEAERAEAEMETLATAASRGASSQGLLAEAARRVDGMREGMMSAFAEAARRAEGLRIQAESARARAVDAARTRDESEEALGAVRERAARAATQAERWARELPALEEAAERASARARALSAAAAGGDGAAVRERARSLAQAQHSAEAVLSEVRARVERSEEMARHASAEAAIAVKARDEAREAVGRAEAHAARAETALRDAQMAAQRLREGWLEAQAAQRASGGGRGGRSGGSEMVAAAARSGRLEGVRGLLGDLIVPDDGMEVAIDAALGGAVSDVVVDRAAHAEAAVAFLRTQGGRATFLPLDRVTAREGRRPPAMDGVIGIAAELVRYDEAIRAAVLHRLGNVWVVRTLRAALVVAERTGQSQRLVTLEGDVVAPGGAITGGAARAPRLGRTGSGAAAADLVALKTKADASEEAARGAESARREAQSALARTRQEALSWERKAAEETARAQAAESRVREAREALTQAERANSEASVAAAAAASAVEALRAATAEDAAAAVDEEQRAAALEEANTAAQAVGEARGARAAAEEEARRAREEAGALEQRLAALSASPAAPEEGTESAYEQARVQVDALEAEMRRSERLSRVLGALAASARVAAERAAGQRLAAVERAEGRRREAQEAAHAAEEARARLIAAFGADAEAEAARHLESLRGSEAQLGEQAATLRRQRGELGPVWPGAEEAHALASERLQALDEELAAVEEGRRALLSLAEQARRRMDRAVGETLDRVRGAFGGAVTALLGGAGDLTAVTGEENGGEGIELHIALPGKKRTALGGLSGGERALGALAFLFGLLAVRPSALVLLDEVEAALDPANAARFARYLRSASISQQFLVITHQRPTMESAHALWGFTAQEAGVSHLVTVRLEGRPPGEDEIAG